MERATYLGVLEQVRAARAKQAAAAPPFQATVQQMANRSLQAGATADVKNLALAALGVGAGARGLTGLYNLLANRGPGPARGGPAELPLPYPVEPDDPALAPPAKQAGLADQVTIKPAIPWYGPAMLTAGLAGLGGGWAGMDAVLDHRRKAERDQEISQARQEFHDALLGQYDRPLRATPGPAPARQKRAGDAAAMADAGATLGRAFALLEKVALNWADVAGTTLGGYGMYALPAAAVTGTIVYDKARKRSQRAVIRKALQRREQRRFMEQPSEIYARPEPVTVLPRPTPADEEELYKPASVLARFARFAAPE